MAAPTDDGGVTDSQIKIDVLEQKRDGVSITPALATGGSSPERSQDGTSEKKEFVEVALDENKSSTRVPKRILHFSDGILEEYSTDDEDTSIATNQKSVQSKEITIDPWKLAWIPFIWYYMAVAGSKTLYMCDYMGESLASFFGITTPKYQYAVDEYQRGIDEENAENERDNREKAAAFALQQEVASAGGLQLAQLEGGTLLEQQEAWEQVKQKPNKSPAVIQQVESRHQPEVKSNKNAADHSIKTKVHESV